MAGIFISFPKHMRESNRVICAAVSLCADVVCSFLTQLSLAMYCRELVCKSTGAQISVRDIAVVLEVLFESRDWQRMSGSRVQYL